MNRRDSIAETLGRVVLFLIIAVSFVGCRSITGPESPGGNPDLQMGIKVPVASNEIESIPIVFSAVQALRESNRFAEWVSLPVGDWPVAARTFELLDVLGGLEAILGDATFEPGVYTQMRILVEDASIRVGGVLWPLKINGNALRIHEPFEVGPSGVPLLPLDFNPSKAVKEKPRAKYPYSMDGLLRLGDVPPVPETGSISGVVVPSVYALVSAYVSGTQILVASVYTDTDTDVFLLGDLDAGTYDLEASAPGFMSGWEMGVALAAGELSDGHVLELQPIGGGEKR